MADIRYFRPDSGFGFQVQDLNFFQGVPSSLWSGIGDDPLDLFALGFRDEC